LKNYHEIDIWVVGWWLKFGVIIIYIYRVFFMRSQGRNKSCKKISHLTCFKTAWKRDLMLRTLKTEFSWRCDIYDLIFDYIFYYIYIYRVSYMRNQEQNRIWKKIWQLINCQTVLINDLILTIWETELVDWDGGWW